MYIVVLDAKTLGSDLDLNILKKFGTLSQYETTSDDKIIERIKIADIIITNKVVITKEIMAHAPKLKLICVAATGMNNIDLNAAKIQGVAVKNVSGYSTKSVAQHTFAMALYLLEKISYYDKITKDNTWANSGLFTDISHPFFEISGKKWGVIGLGAIGKEVAGIAEAFGAEVHYFSTSGKNHKTAYPHKSLEFLLKDCDIISIHAPLNSNTYDLINEINLPYLKEKAILLNLGRGGIINETDLAFELDRREIYAGLDVLEQEPITPNNRLNEIKHKERLLITPHIAWTSIEARKRLLEGIVENITSFLKSQA